MDCRTGNIYESNSEKEMESLQAKFHQENKLCPCGSEVKFKRCCWTAYA